MSGSLLAKANPQQAGGCLLIVNSHQGLIFSSSIKPVSCTISMAPENKSNSYAILVLDKNSNEIFRKSLRSDESPPLETSFTWDLKSSSNSYVESGCYTLSLIDTPDEIECCSVKCKVVDTRKIVSATESLKHSSTFTSTALQALSSIYFDIIKDIQREILERLENNKFEEPYFIACATTYFIQGIADDLQNRSRGRFLDLIAEYQARHPISEHQIRTARLGLRALFDFLINYMSDAEDHMRADAMAKCGQSRFTQNDKAQIISSLVSAIYPHCKMTPSPKNVLGSIAEKILGRIVRLGIKYVSTRHINRSVSICQALPLGNHCDVIFR